MSPLSNPMRRKPRDVKTVTAPKRPRPRSSNMLIDRDKDGKCFRVRFNSLKGGFVCASADQKGEGGRFLYLPKLSSRRPKRGLFVLSGKCC